MEFNHADLFEALADTIGDRVALAVSGTGPVERLTYAELDAHANRLAHHLESAGVGRGDRVAVQLYNGVEYIATVLAALKIRAVPVNVNYRYVEAELDYLFRDADPATLVYDVECEARVNGTASAPAHRIVVGGSSAHAMPYAEALASGSPERGFPERSGDDLYIIYTGGTTGMPKGVMWRIEDLFMAFGGGNPGGPPRTRPEEVIEAAGGSGPMVMLAAAPLMHGAAQMATFICWSMGGTIVYTRRFEPAEVLRAIEREQVFTINITGDAMARPLTEELATGRYDPASLVVISSTGAILSATVRDRLRELLPNAMVLDNFGSSESGFAATGVDGPGMRYRANQGLCVLDDDLTPVQPGSATVGQVARSGHIASGYWRDPEKTARTFVEAGGVRWLLTGDLATVAEDGAIEFLGRGSQCVNTGGEKVFPEEVEAVLKAHPGVFDAVVTGVPDPRFGSQVAAVVQPYAEPPAVADLDAHCRAVLSGYKVPRTYAFVAQMRRSPAGKADYRWARTVAEEAAQSSHSDGATLG